MRTVYLDHWIWINLARASNGLDKSRKFAAVLDFVRDARDRNLACFPLMITHYQENAKVGGPGRRLRLARFMRELSGGLTLMPPSDVLTYEIEGALSSRFSSNRRGQNVRALNLMGEGYWHADGRPTDKPSLPRPHGEFSSPSHRLLYEQIVTALDQVLELSVLSGVSVLTGAANPTLDLRDEESGFQRDLAGLQRLRSVKSAEREDEIYRLALRDIVRPIASCIDRLEIPQEEVTSSSFGDWKSLLDELPTQRFVVHLMGQWAKSEALNAKPSEFYDWMLEVPAMYCDVLVTEKQLGDLLGRDGFRPRAKVIKDVRQLPDVLIELSR